MKIILDECVPGLIRTALPHHDIVTVQYKGWSGIKNGELLRRVAAEFDIFVTSDQNLRYQQNLSQFEIALVVLPSNQVPAVKAVLPEIDEALKRIKPSELIEI